MMFLSNVSLASVVKAQVKFKLQAFIGSFLSLIFIQVLALLLTSSTGTSGTSFNGTEITFNIFTLDGVFVFVAIWAVFVGNLITTKAYRYDDFSFVSTRLSSNIANIIVLMIVSIIAAVTTFLSTYLLRLYQVVFSKVEFIKSPGILNEPGETVMTLLLLFILIWMLTSFGYLLGALVQKHKGFIILLPLLFVGLVITSLGQNIIQYFFIVNGDLWSFMLKVLGVTVIFFIISLVAANRWEVRA
ncbi:MULTISPECIES: hypothetical protein [Psychrobacillus]|uniref:ABC transporter permease n=1 Tax=Psychrobacillus faecigallinarum TaxID=2762235 RepID=A0ABR8REQ3_9BACI|nr:MULTISPECIES: hypothetical protein [Psychrobacillus]MBD7946294.1 hypothetical protein [Psychrobacillus faecigallinarum]QEY21936.1 hypothetical protein D0S48_15365 [Psychrobacillus sp. AK 1817]